MYRHWWQYVRHLPAWLWWGAKRKPFVWVSQNDDDDYVEAWNRQIWMVIRPRYTGFVKKLECGCSRRFGKMQLYNMDCVEHGRPGWRDR